MEKDLDILIDKIKTAKTIAIMGHKNPDGDSLCSVLALAKLIEINFNKRPLCIYDGNIPDALDNVPLRHKIKYYERADLSVPFDLVFVLDYGTVNHLGGGLSVAQNAKFVIEIDHHKNDDKIGNLCIDDTRASATGEIIYDLMQMAGWQYDIDIANLFAVSLITDTGYFKYSNTSRPLEIMARLMDYGVNIRYVAESMNNKPRRTVQTEAGVAARAEFFHHGRLALATVTAEDYKKLDGRGDIVFNLLSQIKGVEYIVLLKHAKENQIGLSFRSRGQPVNHIAEEFGGGGHPCAAGGCVLDSLENVRARIIERFKGM